MELCHWTKALRGTGVSPAISQVDNVAQERRRDAGATKWSDEVSIRRSTAIFWTLCETFGARTPQKSADRDGAISIGGRRRIPGNGHGRGCRACGLFHDFHAGTRSNSGSAGANHLFQVLQTPHPARSLHSDFGPHDGAHQRDIFGGSPRGAEAG